MITRFVSFEKLSSQKHFCVLSLLTPMSPIDPILQQLMFILQQSRDDDLPVFLV